MLSENGEYIFFLSLRHQDDTSKYRQLLVRTLHSCCIKFPDTATTVIPLLMEFLSDGSDDLAAQVRNDDLGSDDWRNQARLTLCCGKDRQTIKGKFRLVSCKD